MFVPAPNQDLDYQQHMLWSVFYIYVQWVEVKSACSFCWCWWNRWQKVFKRFFSHKTNSAMLITFFCMFCYLQISSFPFFSWILMLVKFPPSLVCILYIFLWGRYFSYNTHLLFIRGCRDHMVDGLTSTHSINTYHP